MSDELIKELSRLQLLSSRCKNKMSMRPLSITLEENRAYLIFNYIKELQQENKKYKKVIFTIKMRISAKIKEYQQKIDNEIDMGSQGDSFKICRYEKEVKFLNDMRRLLEKLEVENEKI